MDLVTAETPILIFDGSFEGWHTCVFTIYENGWQHTPIVTIQAEHEVVPNFWQATVTVATDEAKTLRVSDKLARVFGKNGMRQLLWGFLSESPTVYSHLFGVVRFQLSNPNFDVWENYTHADVMAVSKLIKMVGRARHRMQAFVRFEQMQMPDTDKPVYFARVEPDFNVLPILHQHFKERYADQTWAIYDVKRGFGIYYAHDDPSEQVHIICEVDDEALLHPQQFYSEAEQQYQTLWQKYFTHVTIKERLNRKLHIQYLPKRYWKYLTEKMV